MYRYLSRGAWFALAVAVVVVGGTVLGVSQHQQTAARDQLARLEIANDNLRMVVQARIDLVFDQTGPALTPAEDSDIAEHADELRALADNTEPDLAFLLDYLDLVEDERGVMRSIALTLHSLEVATKEPARDALAAATTVHHWALGLTGAALLALLTIEVRRPEDER